MSQYTQLQEQLRSSPCTWLVTGAAGFIGSNLVEALLKLDQVVVGLDNFSTGNKDNLSEVQSCVSHPQWQRFSLVTADIEQPAARRTAMAGIDYVLHQAALGSVPRSIADPIATNASNVSGFLNWVAVSRDTCAP